MEHIVTSLVELFSETIPGELTVFLLSLMPIIELRGGILAAKLLQLDMLPAFFICLVGTILPTPLSCCLSTRFLTGCETPGW